MKHNWVMLTEFKDGVLCFHSSCCEVCLVSREEKDEHEPCAGPPAFYKLVGDPTTGAPGILCLVCGRTSYHRQDIEQRYCALCKRFYPENRVPREETAEL
jgi:hypothetical protein